MSLSQLRNVNMGPNRANATGSTGVGYTVLDAAGAVVTPRTTVGVYQLTSGSGIYAAYISFPDAFRGQVLWDTGVSAFPTASYATEQYNVEENNPNTDNIWGTVQAITGSIQLLRDMTAGRWKIDSSTNVMSFYKEDNVTLVAQFDLFDDLGNPSSDAVFERTKLP